MDTAGLFSVAGRVALVTGGSAGIGRMIATGLAAAGARVYICARGADKVARAAADIAGSIALTINSSNLPADQRTALLASGGILEKAFLKLAGKAGLPDSNALKGAIADVKNSVAGALAGYEDGTLFAQLATTFNDKETDKRNR